MSGDVPGGPVVRNLPSKAGGAGLIPGRGTRIPHAIEQLIPRAATKRAHTAQLRSNAAKIKNNNNNETNLVSEENII